MQNHLLEMDAKRATAPTWETVRYMVSAIQYGGRITDEFDKLLMDTYAEKYFQQVWHTAPVPFCIHKSLCQIYYGFDTFVGMSTQYLLFKTSSAKRYCAQSIMWYFCLS